jgi:hypothetical protein
MGASLKCLSSSTAEPRQGRTIALLHWFRRLRIRWEIRDDIHEAFIFAITEHCPVPPGGPSCAAGVCLALPVLGR